MNIDDIVIIRSPVNGRDNPDVAQHWCGSKCKILRKSYSGNYILEFINEKINDDCSVGNLIDFSWAEDELELVDDFTKIESEDFLELFKS